MRLLAVFGIVTTLATLLSPLKPMPAFACSCGARTYEEVVSGAELILVGTVREVRFEGRIEEAIAETPPNAGRPAEGVVGKLTIDVEQYLKGDAEPTVVVEQGVGGVYVLKMGDVGHVELMGGPNCHLFSGDPSGLRYLLFLSRTESGDYRNNACSGSGTSFAEEGIAGIREIVARVKTLPASGGPGGADQSPTNLLLLTGVIFTALGAGTVALVRYRRIL